MTAKPSLSAGASAPAPLTDSPTTTALTIREPSGRGWMQPFLAALAETSNVARAARIAGINSSTAYAARRKQRDFARKWQSAVHEGYEHLRLEVLCRLREGEIKPAAGAKRGVRSYDNAGAIRLLALHDETHKREQAVQDNVSAAEIRASINRKIALVRARVEAAEAAANGGAPAETDAENDNAAD